MKLSEVLEIIGNYKLRIPPTVYYELKADIVDLDESEKPTGKWETRPHIYGVTFCSKCGYELRINNTNYCPNCGTKMEQQGENT